MNILEIFSGVARWISAILFSGVSQWIASFFLVKCLDILFDVWQYISLTICRSSHGILFRYIFGRLEVNYLDILSSELEWTIWILGQKFHRRHSRHFVCRFTANYLYILCSVLGLIISNKALHREYSRYIVGRLTEFFSTLFCLAFQTDIVDIVWGALR